MHISESTLLSIIGWLISSHGTLVAMIIGLYLWMSRRELTRNEEHKKEIEESSRQYIQLQVDVINEKLHFLQMISDRNEIKSEAADKDLKELIDRSRINERELYQRDEHTSKEVSKTQVELKQDISNLQSQIAHLDRRSIKT